MSQDNEAIQKLVDAAGSNLRRALEVLFINNRNIPRFIVVPGKEMLGLIEVGPAEELEKINKFISYAKSRFSLKFGPQILEYVRPIIDLSVQLTELRDKIRPGHLPALTDLLREGPMYGPPLLVEKSVAEYYSAALLKPLIDQWREQPDALRDDKVLESLRHLDLIIPQLQINICVKCGNFELLMGSYPFRDLNCPKCGASQVHARIYSFDERYAQFKKEDKDLPLFICSYMNRYRIEACAFKTFPPDVEFDVYVKDSNTDMECTMLLRPLAADEQDVKSVAGDLVTQKIEKRLGVIHQLHVKRVVIFTNLSKKDSERLEREIQKKLKQRKIEFNVQLIAGTLEEFINALHEEVKIALESL